VVLPEEVDVREQVEVDCFQGVVGQSREAEAAHLQRTEMPVGKVHLESCKLMAEEADIEGGVVGDKDAAGAFLRAFRR
jgi:hypothetical protein